MAVLANSFTVAFIPRNTAIRDRFYELRCSINGRSMVERPATISLQKHILGNNGTQRFIVNHQNWQINPTQKVIILTNKHVTDRRYDDITRANVVWARFPEWARHIYENTSFLWVSMTFVGTKLTVKSNLSQNEILSDDWLTDNWNVAKVSRCGTYINLSNELRFLISFGNGPQVSLHPEILPIASPPATAAPASNQTSSSTATVSASPATSASSTVAVVVSPPAVAPKKNRNNRKRKRSRGRKRKRKEMKDSDTDDSGSNSDNGRLPPPKRARFIVAPITMNYLTQQNRSLERRLAISEDRLQIASVKEKTLKKKLSNVQKNVKISIGGYAIVKHTKELTDHIGF